MNNVVRFWLRLSIFRISRSRSRNKFRNERRTRDSAHVGTMIIMIIDRPCVLSFRDLVFIFLIYLFLCLFLLYDQEISSLVLSFSEHCARKKKTKRPGKLSEEGCNEWFLIFWIFFESKGWEIIIIIIILSLLLVLVIRSFCCCVLSGQFACWPIIWIQSSWASRFYYQCCD